MIKLQNKSSLTTNNVHLSVFNLGCGFFVRTFTGTILFPSSSSPRSLRSCNARCSSRSSSSTRRSTKLSKSLSSESSIFVNGWQRFSRTDVFADRTFFLAVLFVQSIQIGAQQISVQAIRQRRRRSVGNVMRFVSFRLILVGLSGHGKTPAANKSKRQQISYRRLRFRKIRNDHTTLITDKRDNVESLTFTVGKLSFN